MEPRNRVARNEKILRVGIEIIPYQRDKNMGMARFNSNLIKHISRIDDVNYYYLYGYLKDPGDILPPRENFHYVCLPRLPLGDNFASREITRQWLLVRQAERDGIVVLHSTLDPVSRVCRAKRLVNIFDTNRMCHYREDGMWKKGRRLARVTLWKVLAKQSDAIITTSHYSKGAIVQRMGISKDRIHVIYPGVDEIFQGNDDSYMPPEVLVKRLGVTKPFLLFVGEMGRQKNEETALDVFRMLRDRGHELQLVLVGKISPSLRLREHMRSEPFHDDVKWLKDVEDAELRALYRRAQMLLFLSRHEGFGFPVLEAMACGAPVIASNCTSLPEVVGRGGIMVDPDDLDDTIRNAELLLTDQEFRRELCERGYRQVQQFSWEACARKVISLYRVLAAT